MQKSGLFFTAGSCTLPASGVVPNPFACNTTAVAQNVRAGQVSHFGGADGGIQRGDFFRFAQAACFVRAARPAKRKAMAWALQW